MKKNNSKLILGACLEDCVHVLGVLNFLNMAERYNFRTKFLGPAVKTDKIIDTIKEYDPDWIAISYRLTPENGKLHISRFISKIKQEKLENKVYLLGALPDLIKEIKPKEFFNYYFLGGEVHDEIIPILRQQSSKVEKSQLNITDLISKIDYNRPYPLLRAHFGLKSMDDTLNGIKELSGSMVLDIISIAPDQAAQECFHRPEELNKMPMGAGGVPIRCREDLLKISKMRNYEDGNKPLLRIYSGTQDLIKNASLFHETINNAWAAIPIFWYSRLDGRGPLPIKDAIEEHFAAIKWHADKNIPVEINDPHQWGLRMAPDHLVVADAYLSAYIAKKLGVKNYIEQMMFNTPPGNNYKMDLARVLAMWEIVQPLIDENFNILKETRAGLAYFSPRPTMAKGQLVASTMMQMAIKPDIMHIVSYCEADHAAEPKDIIESCTIVKRVIQDCIEGIPDMTQDKKIIERKNELLSDAKILLASIQNYGDELGYEDPFLSPKFLSNIVSIGIFDAPQVKGSLGGLGKMKCLIIDGKCVVVDRIGNPVQELDRIDQLFQNLSSKTKSTSIKTSESSTNG